MEPTRPSNVSNKTLKQDFLGVEAADSGEGSNFSFHVGFEKAYIAQSPLNFRHFKINNSDFNSTELTKYLMDCHKKKIQAKISLSPICDPQVLLIIKEYPGCISELDLTECKAKVLFENSDVMFSTTDLFLRVIMDVDKVLLPNDITMEMFENLKKYADRIGCPHIRSGRQLIKYSI